MDFTGEVRPIATTPVSQRLPLTSQRSLTEPNNDVTIDMNLSGSDLNVEQLPSSPGGSSPSGSINNENREFIEFKKVIYLIFIVIFEFIFKRP